MANFNKYLSVYNGILAVLWSVVLYNTLSDVQAVLDPESPDKLTNYYTTKVYDGYPHKFLVRLQLFNAVMETGHVITGLVKSPLATIGLQFSARLLITAGIAHKVPESPGNSHFAAFVTLSLAWSITEIIRYGFYLLKLTRSDVPYQLTWLRYTAFYVLYPAGLFSESYVVYLTLDSVLKNYRYFLLFALTAYIPGFLKLYSYMIGQRRKVLTGRLKFRLA